MHTELEIQVPTVENLAQSNVLHLRPGIGQNVVMHASSIAINDKLQSLCPLSSCPNYCLYAVTVVLLMVVLLMLLIFYIFLFIFSFCLFVFLPEVMVCG